MRRAIVLGFLALSAPDRATADRARDPAAGAVVRGEENDGAIAQAQVLEGGDQTSHEPVRVADHGPVPVHRAERLGQ